jgi:hypothetical protein
VAVVVVLLVVALVIGVVLVVAPLEKTVILHTTLLMVVKLVHNQLLVQPLPATAQTQQHNKEHCRVVLLRPMPTVVRVVVVIGADQLADTVVQVAQWVAVAVAQDI